MSVMLCFSRFYVKYCISPHYKSRMLLSHQAQSYMWVKLVLLFLSSRIFHYSHRPHIKPDNGNPWPSPPSCLQEGLPAVLQGTYWLLLSHWRHLHRIAPVFPPRLCKFLTMCMWAGLNATNRSTIISARRLAWWVCCLGCVPWCRTLLCPLAPPLNPSDDERDHIRSSIL